MLVVNNTTTASIDDGASVAALGDVAVIAHSSGDVLSIAAAAAVSGTASVGGSVSYVGINDTTRANIGDSATSTGTGAQRQRRRQRAGRRHRRHRGLPDHGQPSPSESTGAGIGGAVSIVNLSKNTEAFIGSYATVNALGNVAEPRGHFRRQRHDVGRLRDARELPRRGRPGGHQRERHQRRGGRRGRVLCRPGRRRLGRAVSTRPRRPISASSAQINTSSTGASSAQAVDVSAVNQASRLLVRGRAGRRHRRHRRRRRRRPVAELDAGVHRQRRRRRMPSRTSTSTPCRTTACRPTPWARAVGVVGLVGSVSVWSIGVPYQRRLYRRQRERRHGPGLAGERAHRLEHERGRPDRRGLVDGRDSDQPQQQRGRRQHAIHERQRSARTRPG